MDRGLDWRPLVPQMKELSPYSVICLPDSGSTIAKMFAEEGFEPKGGIQCVADLPSAMALLPGLVREGDTVLLSPGAPSFPHFRDFEDRGKQFAQLAGFGE
jgi:UDP-N-acetylmuramoylalanine--D-glutamate ligase